MVQLGLPLSVRNRGSQSKMIASIQIKVHIAACRQCRIIEWSSQRCLFGSVCADNLKGDQPNLQNKWWFCIFLQTRNYGWYGIFENDIWYKNLVFLFSFLDYDNKELAEQITGSYTYQSAKRLKRNTDML